MIITTTTRLAYPHLLQYDVCPVSQPEEPWQVGDALAIEHDDVCCCCNHVLGGGGNGNANLQKRRLQQHSSSNHVVKAR
jgi:hypothetical protein